MGRLNSQSKELEQAKLAEVPAGGDDNKLDSGGGLAGGMTDQQRYAAYGRGELDMSLDEAVALSKKLGMRS